MQLGMLIIALVAGLILVLVLSRAAGSGHSQGSRYSRIPLPSSLADAKLIFVEHDFSTVLENAGVQFVGRPDRVYQDADGTCHPVQIKSGDNARVYQGHRIQLSLEAFLLRRNGYKTGAAYVSFVECGVWEAVHLFDDARCVELILDRARLPNLEWPPLPIEQKAKCVKCEHRTRCDSV